jgi:hypothetical protein
MLKPSEPEALIYEPQPSGSLRLVGIEFIVFGADGGERAPTANRPRKRPVLPSTVAITSGPALAQLLNESSRPPELTNRNEGGLSSARPGGVWQTPCSRNVRLAR